MDMLAQITEDMEARRRQMLPRELNDDELLASYARWIDGQKLKPPIVSSVQTMSALGKSHLDRCIYIGRAYSNARYGAFPASIWQNRFIPGKDGPPIVCVQKYEAGIRANAELMAMIPSLSGKVLICWCKTAKNPHALCHGDALVKLWKEWYESNQRNANNEADPDGDIRNHPAAASLSPDAQADADNKGVRLESPAQMLRESMREMKRGEVFPLARLWEGIDVV